LWPLQPLQPNFHPPHIHAILIDDGIRDGLGAVYLVAGIIEGNTVGDEREIWGADAPGSKGRGDEREIPFLDRQTKLYPSPIYFKA